jgi:type II secretory pathway pseudopilin PulG
LDQTNKTAGYTLIELLLYISLTGILLVSLTVFFGMSVDARIKTQSVTEVNQQGASAMDYLQQTVRNATSISAPAAAATTASLTVVVPTASLSPTVFNVNGTILQVKEGAAAAIPLTNDDVQITNLTFTNLTRSGTDGAVRISFTVSRTNIGGRNEYDYSKTFTTTVAIR